MKINVTAAILDLNGDPLVEAGEILTLRKVCQTVLLSALKGDEDLGGEDKAKFWNLACDAREDSVEWTPEQVALVRARIGVGYGPVVVGPAFKLLG